MSPTAEKSRPVRSRVSPAALARIEEVGGGLGAKGLRAAVEAVVRSSTSWVYERSAADMIVSVALWRAAGPVGGDKMGPEHKRESRNIRLDNDVADRLGELARVWNVAGTDALELLSLVASTLWSFDLVDTTDSGS